MEKTINKLLLVALAGTLFFGWLTYRYRNAEHDNVCQDEHSFPLFEYISVDLQRLPVSIIPYDEGNIRIEYKNDLPLSFEIGDNKLSITESDKFTITLLAGNRSDFGLYIYLPREEFREISVYTGSGDIKIGGVDCRMISAISDTGNILCENMISFANLTTSSGSISADFDTVVSNTEIVSQSGNVEVVIPRDSSVSVNFETQTGYCVTELWDGMISGSYIYSFNGGEKPISATLEKGVLTIKEKG